MSDGRLRTIRQWPRSHPHGAAEVAMGTMLRQESYDVTNELNRS